MQYEMAFGSGPSSCGLASRHVRGLKTFRALQQIELHRLAFIQRPVALLLDGGEMHEHVLSRRSLDEPITLRAVEPLHCALLSHEQLLSPLGMRGRCFHFAALTPKNNGR